MSCWLLRINALHAKRETHEKYLRYAGHAALLVSLRENLDILITEPTASYLARKHWLTFSLATTWCAFPLPPPAYTLHKCSFLLFLFCSAANKHLWQTYSAQQCFAAAGNGCVLSVHLGGGYKRCSCHRYEHSKWTSSTGVDWKLKAPRNKRSNMCVCPAMRLSENETLVISYGSSISF